MNHSLMHVAVAVLTTATVAGCAPAAEAPEAKGTTASHEETNGGGAGGAIFLPIDEQNILYRELDGTQGNVIVCADGASADLVSQIKAAGDTPNVVVARTDGSYDARVTDRPRYEQDTYLCNPDRGGGPAYIFYLRDQNADFITQDLSAAFVNGFTGKSFECDGAFQLSGLDIDVKGFRVANGKIQAPDVTLKLEGDSAAAISAHCSLKASSGQLFVQAGPVPVFYELEISVGLSISLSKASHVSATIGTEGGRLSTDDPEITITPEIELGVTFYGVVGGYVGIGFPVTVSPHPPCTPDITLAAEVKVGAQAGLLGIGDLPITKALSVEVASPVLGPWSIATSQCN